MLAPAPETPLRLLCEAAARALRCTVHLDVRVAHAAPERWRVDFEPRTGACTTVAPAGPGPHGDAVCVPVAGDGVAGTLCCHRGDGSRPWTADDDALAHVFARLAAGTAAAREPRPPAADAETAALRAALERSEAHFRRMIENVSDLVMISAADGALTYVSPSAERLLGYRTEELIGKGPDDLVHPDDLPALWENMRAMTQVPGTVSALHHWRIRHRDGGWREMEAIGRSLAPDTVDEGLVITARDVTARREAEAALRASEEHFRTLIDNSHDMVVLLDPQTARHTYQSPSVQRILGYDPEEFAALDAFALIHPDDAPRALAVLGDAVAHPGETRHAEYRYRHKDGSWRYLETFGRTLSAHSAERGLVFNTRDVTERREAELALARREEHFRALTENAHDIIAILDPRTGHITYQTPSMERILGYAPGELAGQNAIALVHPDDVARTAAEIARVVAEPGRTFHARYRYRHKDGSWRHLESYGRTLSPTGAEQGLVLNTGDVTERTLAELALQQSEAKYRSLIEAAQDMITVIDADGTIAFQSPSAERVLGFTPEEMVGRGILEFLHPDDLPMAVERMAAVASSPGTVVIVQYRNRCKDGSYRHVESTGRTVLPDSTAAGVVGIVRDITDRVEAEAALRAATAQAERAREEAERTATRDRLLAEASRLLVASSDTATALEQLARHLVQGWADACTVELEVEGGRTPVAVAGAVGERASALRVPLTAGGASDGWVTLARGAGRAPFDADDRALAAELARRAGLSLENARLFQAAQEAVAARDRVLAIVAHDLRSPLAAVRFDAEMLRMRPSRPLAARDARTLERIEGTLARMDALIEDLLDVSRLNHDALTLDRRPHDMGALLRDAAETLRPLVRGHGLRFEVQAGDGMPRLDVDGARLVQAVSNLVGNATKFAAHEGTVALAWEIAGDELRIAVRDDGPGIPPEELQHIFGAFWQARHGDRRGLGLGLAIARAIAEAHGGRLWVESEVGRGSTFVLALPIAPHVLPAG